MKRGMPLNDNPKVSVAIDDAKKVATKLKAEKPSMNNIQDLMGSPELKNIFEDILEMSRMTDPVKNYVRMVFLQKKPKSKAFAKVFGKDLGYQEEAVSEAIMQNQGVKEFLDVVKMFYVQVAPIAALKEVEMMLDPKTNDKVRLAAIQGIKKSAGVAGSDDGGGAKLPVQVVINMPQQTNVQVNNP